MRVTVRVGIGGEPLGIVRKAKVELRGVRADGQVLVDSIQGALNTTGMHGDVVTAVHQIVAHDVDHVHGLEDLGALLLGEGDHVLLAAWDGDGQGLVADGFLHGGKEQGVGLDLVDFVLIGDLFVVLAVAARVFPVDVCTVLDGLEIRPLIDYAYLLRQTHWRRAWKRRSSRTALGWSRPLPRQRTLQCHPILRWQP